MSRVQTHRRQDLVRCPVIIRDQITIHRVLSFQMKPFTCRVLIQTRKPHGQVMHLIHTHTITRPPCLFSILSKSQLPSNEYKFPSMNSPKFHRIPCTFQKPQENPTPLHSQISNTTPLSLLSLTPHFLSPPLHLPHLNAFMLSSPNIINPPFQFRLNNLTKINFILRFSSNFHSKKLIKKYLYMSAFDKSTRNLQTPFNSFRNFLISRSEQ